MAEKSLEAVPIRAWKEHTCVGCGSCYRYPLTWRQFGLAGGVEAAVAAAHAAAVRSLKNKVEIHPCPVCGRYQPEMVEKRRAAAHAIVLAASIVSLTAFLFIAFGPLADVVGTSTAFRIAPLTAAVVAGLALGAHAVVGWWDPNRNLDANQKRAAEGVARGALKLGPYDPSRVEARRGQPWLVWGPYLLIALAVALFPLAESLRLLYDYPANADCWPTVAGSGDTVRVYFPRHIDSVKGLWRGQAAVRVLNAEELGLPDAGVLSATSASRRWDDIGGEIQENDKHSNMTPWADLSLPADRDLGGRALNLQIDLDVVYPIAEAKNVQGCHNVEALFQQNPTIVLASSPRAGALYMVWWTFALVSGCALTALGGLVLAIRSAYLERPSSLSRIYVSNVEDAEQPDRVKQAPAGDGFAKDDLPRPPIRDETAVRKPDAP